MISRMPTDEELNRLASVFKVVDVTSDNPTPLYSFQQDCLESLIGFAETVGCRLLFIERMYVRKEDLRISNEMFQGLKMEIIGGVQFDSHRFNRDLEAMDLSSPVEIRIFLLYEGKAFGVHYIEPDLDQLRSITPERRVAIFAEARLDKLREKTVIEAKKEDPEIEKFCDILLLDRMYRNLRDDNERMNYVIKIARRPGNDNLKKIVYKSDGSGFSTEKIRMVVALTLKKTDTTRDNMTQMVFKKE